jgi:ferritin-like metal-binding protein YciE
MHEDQPSAEKDFVSLINQFSHHSEVRDQQISEIDNILDRIKQNRRPNAEAKQAPSTLINDPPMVVIQLRELIQKVDKSNEKLSLIIQRLNELI